MAAIRFGPYQLIAPLGEGSAAVVYRATRARDGGEVALKRIRPHLARDRGFVASLLDEATICAGLEHPGIVRLHGLEKIGGEYAVALEYVDGVTLKRLLGQLSPEAPMSAAAACALVAQIARALAYAHARVDDDGRPLGIVHRDVNPSNIMVTRSGAAKLLDFGIALAAAHVPREGATDTGFVKGTLGYLSPEQADGAALDGRSDLFSLGVVLYECLTGVPLFDARRPLESLRLLSQSDFAPPSRVRMATAARLDAEVGAAIDAVCARLLAQRPADRYADGAEAAAALEAVVVRLGGADAATAELIELVARVPVEVRAFAANDIEPVAGTRRLRVLRTPRGRAVLLVGIGAAAAALAVAGALLRRTTAEPVVSATTAAGGPAAANRLLGPAPTLPPGLHGEGIARLRIGDYAAARDRLEKALAARPGDADVQLALVRAWAGLGQRKRAREIVTAALRPGKRLARVTRLRLEAESAMLDWRWPDAEHALIVARRHAPGDIDDGLALVNVQLALDRREEALATLRMLENLPAPQRDDPRIAVAWATHVGTSSAQRFEAVRIAREKAEAHGADLLVAAVERAEAVAHRNAAQPRKMIEVAGRAKRRYLAAGRWIEAADLATFEAYGYEHLNDRARAIAASEEALAIAGKVDDPRRACAVYCSSGRTLARLGRHAQGRATLEQSLRFARLTREHCHATLIQRGLANMAVDAGDLRGGLAQAEAAVKEGRRVCPTNLHSDLLAAARHHGRSGHHRVAEAYTAESLTLTREGRHGGLTAIVMALRQRAAELRRQDRLGEARAALDEAMQTASNGRARPEVPWIQADLAEVALAEGKLGEAESLAEAAMARAKKQRFLTVDVVEDARAVLFGVALERHDVAGARRVLAEARAAQPVPRDFERRMLRAMAEARLMAAEGDSKAAREGLADLRRQAERRGFVTLAFEARLAALKVGPRSPGGARALQLEARRKGFTLIAREAQASATTLVKARHRRPAPRPAEALPRVRVR